MTEQFLLLCHSLFNHSKPVIWRHHTFHATNYMVDRFFFFFFFWGNGWQIWAQIIGSRDVEILMVDFCHTQLLVKGLQITCYLWLSYIYVYCIVHWPPNSEYISTTTIESVNTTQKCQSLYTLLPEIRHQSQPNWFFEFSRSKWEWGLVFLNT